MSDVVISVENLSKSYLIGHDGPQERYHSLRDTLVRHGKNFARKTLDMARGRQIIQGDSVEEFWALKDVSFEVKRGEVLGIIGRNGAGKSTLLKVLSRITEPTSGRVVLDGRVASLLEVGTGFHPELTGRENIFLNGAILGMGRAEIKQKFDEIVDFAGVEKFLDTPVKRYSSGMYVRLAFAVAAHLEPEILIIDEVLAVGDAEFQKKCLGKMQDVAKGGRTVLYVSHQMSSIRALCSSCVVLASGEAAFRGNVEKGIDSYRKHGDANNHSRSNKICVVETPGLNISEIRFNGTFTSQFHVASDCRRLTVDVIGHADRQLKADIELSIEDQNGTPFAFFASGHEATSAKTFGPGEFKLSCAIELPRLLQGQFVISLDLAHANVCRLARAKHVATMVTEGWPTVTGEAFLASQRGFVFLQQCREGS
jgi:ABC-type polysaccharide/polyol phosphate transport system ATPase subunit